MKVNVRIYTYILVRCAGRTYSMHTVYNTYIQPRMGVFSGGFIQQLDEDKYIYGTHLSVTAR